MASREEEIQIQDIAWKIESEGLGYAIMGYFNPSTVDEWPVPQEIKDAWKAAEENLAIIEAYFEPYWEM